MLSAVRHLPVDASSESTQTVINGNIHGQQFKVDVQGNGQLHLTPSSDVNPTEKLRFAFAGAEVTCLSHHDEKILSPILASSEANIRNRYHALPDDYKVFFVSGEYLFANSLFGFCKN